MTTLGSSFSPSLRVKENQKVVQQGPYSIVRHPGYAANLILMLSTGYAISPSFILLGLLLGIFLFVWGNRMSVEESMMCRDEKLGSQYQEYMKKVKYRVIPFIY